MSSVGSILTNQGALDALQSISNTSNTNDTLEAQLSSGLAINSPADNPAGYITAQGFTSQLNGINQAVSNANQGVSLLQTAQGALNQQVSIVQKLNSIAVQAANGTQTSQEETSLQNVVSQLTSQVDTIATQTQFNNINLLDGTFTGVQFQVGANEGQTISLSISSTKANAIGLNASTVKFTASSVYNTVNTASSASGAISKGTPGSAVGAFTAGTVGFTGNNGGTGSYTVAKNTSAASISAQINAVSGTTGISAQATTKITFAATAGSGSGATSGFSFKLAGSGGSSNAQQITAKNVTDLVSEINGKTASTGVTASLNTSSQLVLTQSNGQNILITKATAGSLATTGSTPVKLGTAGSASATIQGQVAFQSSDAFSLSNAADIGLNTASTLSSLSNVNVTTTAGANSAINVVKFALQGLGNAGGELGAVQQRLQANINNLNTTGQNLNSALGVVQDANIPQVSNQLTQAQIQAQAGVAALKSSTTLQQSFLSLLP
jgi:flagellin